MLADEPDEALLPSLLMQWITRERRCRAIVTAKLKMIWANHAFMKKLQTGRFLSSKDGYLLISSPQGQSETFDALDNCGNDPEHVWIGDGDDGILITMAKLEYEPPYFAVEVVDQSLLPEAIEPALQAAFGLTNAENRVLVQMIMGEPADEISRSLGVSVETVRSHIKKIYDKLSVSSRERLFSRLLPFVVLG